MDTSSPATDKPTAIELTALVEDAFFEALARTVPAASVPAIRERKALRRHQVDALVHNELDEMNVGYTLLAVAALDVLAPSIGRDEALRVIDACLNEPLREAVLRGTRQMLDEAPDAFRALVDASREREHHYFGPSFVFEHVIDDSHGYVLHIPRCLYHEVLFACDALELQPVMCRADVNWIDAIDPAVHHVRFVRPSTFATGGLCRMWFMRTDGDDRVRLPVVHGS
jgi:hypothetical protein